MVLPSWQITAVQPRAPFIYYYSYPQNAFIIERGDGTESRVLVHYTLPDGFDIISGPGWSASGRWFAWGPAIAGSGTFSSQPVTVISRDGQHKFPILEGQGPVEDLSWSPVDDLLMVQLHRVDGTFEMFIFDPAVGKVLIHEATINGSYISYDRVIWLPDGRYMESVSSPDGPPTRKRIVDPRSGKPEEVAVDLSHPCYEDILPFSDDNGWTIYRQAGAQTLGLKNILTGATVQVTSPAPTIRFVDWNRAGTYALIFTDEFCEDTLQPREPVQLWLLSVRSRSLMLVDAYAANPAGWPIHRDDEQSAWSPSANSAWYFDSDEKLHLIRLPTSTSETVDLPVSGEISWNNVFWTPSGDRLIMALTAYQGPQNTLGIIYTLDPTSNVIEPLKNAPQLQTWFHAAQSSDGKYLAYSRPCIPGEWPGACVLDTISGTLVKLKPIQLGSMDYLEWHPARPWLFANSSDVQDFGLLFVASADGQVQREVQTCTYNRSCYGWLPDEK